MMMISCQIQLIIICQSDRRTDRQNTTTTTTTTIALDTVDRKV